MRIQYDFQHVFETTADLEAGIVEVDVSFQQISVTSNDATTTSTPLQHDYVRTDIINPNKEGH